MWNKLPDHILDIVYNQTFMKSLISTWCQSLYFLIRSNLTTIKTISFNKKSFFYTILGFTQIHSGSLGNIGRFIQLIHGTNKSEKPITITGIDKIHLKADCTNGSVLNGIREPFLYCFGLDKPPGDKIYQKPRIKFFKKINKFVSSHIAFYLEYDDRKALDFNGEPISFTCQLIKIS